MSRLADMQARFQQKQMQEKEEKLLKLYESQQQRAFDRVGRGSSGGTISGGTSPVGAGKVRQMFDERRQKAGIDRSYPLEPLKSKANGHLPIARAPSLDRNTLGSKSTVRTASTFKTTVQRSVTQSRPGKPLVTRSVKQSIDATYVNGELVTGNAEYSVLNDDDEEDPMAALKNQQRELELMMGNARIEDEQFHDIGIEDVDAGVPDSDVVESETKVTIVMNGNTDTNKDDAKPNDNHVGVSENRAKTKGGYGKMNESHRKTNGAVSTGHSPTKKSPTARAAPTATKTPPKKPILKTQSSPVRAQPVKTTTRPGSALSSPTTKKPVMKPTYSPAARPAVTPKTSAPRGGGTNSAVNRDDLIQCRYCGRRFANDRLQLHEDICARTLKKKRKTYDPVKHRVAGTEAEGYVRRAGKAPSSKPKPQHIGKSDWRRQHEEFISTIRAAKQAQAHVARGGKLTDLPPPPPSLNPDYVQCPYCGRRFNEGAATRHIPKCATMLHNKPNRPGLPSPPKKR